MIHWSRYKLNKSGQPSRYAYDVLKAIIDVASADSERDSARALPFAAFLDGLSAPPKTSRPLAQGQQERQTEGESEGEGASFLEWCRKFVVDYEAQRVIEKDAAGQACCECTRAKLQSLFEQRPQRQAERQRDKSTQQIMFSEEHDGVQLQVVETTRERETSGEAFLSVLASNHADDSARLSITGLRNTYLLSLSLSPSLSLSLSLSVHVCIYISVYRPVSIYIFISFSLSLSACELWAVAPLLSRTFP